MRAALILLLLCLLPLAKAHAQGDIHRCIGSNGVPIFTDRVCADVQATPAVPPPSSAPMAASSSALALAGNPSSAPPPAVLCATSGAMLKQAIVDAFADHTPNRLAGLMLWNGDGRDAVVADIRALALLTAQPLLSVSIETGQGSAPDPSDDDNDADSDDNASGPVQSLLIQTGQSGAVQHARMAVSHRNGCLWLHPPVPAG